jgi:sodium/hydrogen antiporter
VNTTGASVIRLVVMVAVLLSIYAHGFSTLPDINLYSKKLASLDENSAEKELTNHLE